MCGICGIYSLSGNPLPEVLQAMNQTMVHRGPDEDGSVTFPRVSLAMRRLSVIGVANGRQPIFNESRDIALIFNGEIYNYRELKAGLLERGHRFSTDSDAETLVHLFEELGESCVDQLRGMFGFALYDGRDERMLLVRDRPGMKPLYYAVHNGYLIFASEIKAIHASGLVPKELDPESLWSYLAYGFVLGERTLFRHVRKLPAGHLMEVSAGRYEVRKYWDLPMPEESKVSPEEAADNLRELLIEAVRRRLISEVPLGAFLSGGVDSSAIVSVMSQELGSTFQTFCVGFGDSRYDELAPARAVADRFGTDHHELVLRGCSPELLQIINRYNDEPAGDSAAVPTFCLSRFARQRVTVALTGEGGDETFAGYPHHRHCYELGRIEAGLPFGDSLAKGLGRVGAFVGSAAPRLQKAAWIAGLPPEKRVSAWLAAFLDAEIEDLLTPELQNAYSSRDFQLSSLIPEPSNSDPLAQLLYFDSRTSLADQLLMKVDKMSMAASLEARCPLLDQDLVEYAAALPTEYKLSSSGSKLVLRQALRTLVPNEILDRPKHGFDVPYDTWLLRDLEPLVSRILLDSEAPIGRYLDLDAVQSLWGRFCSGKKTRPGRQIWPLLNLAVWHEVQWPTGLLGDVDTSHESEVTNALFVEHQA